MIQEFPSLDHFLPDSRSPLALGCTVCEFLERCGGIQDRSQRFSCFDRCKSQCSPDCGNACPNNPSFSMRVGQVGGLTFDNVPRAPRRRIPKLPKYIPFIDHEYLLSGALPFDAVAIPLRRLIRVKTRDCRFSGAGDLRAALGLSGESKVVALGVAKDPNLENLWGLRHDKTLFEELGRLDLAGVSAPNFSSFVDQPRTEDMVNQKRVLLYAHHLQSAGLRTALHWNIFFETDFKHHTLFLQEHEEFDTIAIEFGSGLRSRTVADYFVSHLAASVGKVKRPLRLITKGGIRYLSKLQQAFSSVTFVDTVPFQLARSRHQSLLGNDDTVLKIKINARTKEEVRSLFEANVRIRQQLVLDRLHSSR